MCDFQFVLTPQLPQQDTAAAEQLASKTYRKALAQGRDAAIYGHPSPRSLNMHRLVHCETATSQRRHSRFHPDTDASAPKSDERQPVLSIDMLC